MSRMIQKTSSMDEHGPVGEKWDWPLHLGSDFTSLANTPAKFEVQLETGLFENNEIDVSIAS